MRATRRTAALAVLIAGLVALPAEAAPVRHFTLKGVQVRPTLTLGSYAPCVVAPCPAQRPDTAFTISGTIRRLRVGEVRVGWVARAVAHKATSLVIHPPEGNLAYPRNSLTGLGDLPTRAQTRVAIARRIRFPSAIRWRVHRGVNVLRGGWTVRNVVSYQVDGDRYVRFAHGHGYEFCLCGYAPVDGVDIRVEDPAALSLPDDPLNPRIDPSLVLLGRVDPETGYEWERVAEPGKQQDGRPVAPQEHRYR